MSNTARSIDFVLMRGGTSKAVFLRSHDVPEDRDRLASLLLDIFGSPDRRQIDGLGGADKLTSKAAIVGTPIKADSDVYYLFGQVGILKPQVDFKLNCGNISAAVAAYAVEEGLVAAAEGSTCVRIHSVNTDRIIVAHVPTSNGRLVERGDLTIAGVPGTGAPIKLDFSGFVGAITGKFLPFGEAVTELAVPGFGIVPMSVVDCANLAVFVDARSVGLHGHEGPLEIDGNNEVVARINAIRKAVADRLGLTAFTSASANPFCVIVSKPSEYRTFSSQEEVRPEAFDMLVRSYAADSVSRALPVTITSCTGAASRTPGTLPHSLLSGTAHRRSHIRLGHPSGVIEVECAGTGEGEAFRLSTATVERTARRLAEGRAFLHTDPSWLAHASRDTVRR